MRRRGPSVQNRDIRGFGTCRDGALLRDHSRHLIRGFSLGQGPHQMTEQDCRRRPRLLVSAWHSNPHYFRPLSVLALSAAGLPNALVHASSARTGFSSISVTLVSRRRARPKLSAGLVPGRMPMRRRDDGHRRGTAGAGPGRAATRAARIWPRVAKIQPENNEMSHDPAPSARRCFRCAPTGPGNVRWCRWTSRHPCSVRPSGIGPNWPVLQSRHGDRRGPRYRDRRRAAGGTARPLRRDRGLRRCPDGAGLKSTAGSGRRAGPGRSRIRRSPRAPGLAARAWPGPG